MTEAKFPISVTIYLYGDTLDPDRISAQLGVAPSRARRKGERRQPALPHDKAATTGFWTLGVEEDADMHDLPRIVGGLVDKVGHAGANLMGLPGVEDACVVFFIGAHIGSDGQKTVTFELSEQNITALKAIGLPLRFIVYEAKS